MTFAKNAREASLFDAVAAQLTRMVQIVYASQPIFDTHMNLVIKIKILYVF